jgi:HSP20 family protein
MPGLILWKNQEMSKLKKDMDRLFTRIWDDFGMPSLIRGVRGAPFMDLLETTDHLIIKAELPGVNPNDLDISIIDDFMTIKGESKKEHHGEEEDYHHMERHYGVFSRTLRLPCKITIDDVKATFKDGVLEISMPKCKEEALRGKKIKVK